MPIPRSIDYGSMSNEEYDERIAQARKKLDWFFFRTLLYTRGLPITTAPEGRPEKRVDMGTGSPGDFIAG